MPVFHKYCFIIIEENCSSLRAYGPFNNLADVEEYLRKNEWEEIAKGVWHSHGFVAHISPIYPPSN
jgi:hypothetical protein